METKTRLLKAIDFFRKFSDKASTNLYKRSVLKFCDLVEAYLNNSDDKTYEDAKKVFNEKNSYY